MECPRCSGPARRFGRNRNGSQRYRCDACQYTFTDARTQPADRRRLSMDRAVYVLRLLLEGNSLRAASRLTGIGRNTIVDSMIEAGEYCQIYLDGLRNLPAMEVQADEIWSFVKCKEKTRIRRGYGEEVGDAWTFTAIERHSKMILAWHLGKRDLEATCEFADKLRRVTGSQRFQLSTDGFRCYPSVIQHFFGTNVDYAQLIKVYGNPPEEGGGQRYSPGQVIDAYPVIIMGNPDEEKICTSHAERSNKTIRMQIRRFTRLTDGHSKKWENHEAALALFFCYYNFARVHSTINSTPAQAAGLTDHTWSVAEMLAKVGVPN
jgi:transposase-like protein/IS1 family transposase